MLRLPRADLTTRYRTHSPSTRNSSNAKRRSTDRLSGCTQVVTPTTRSITPVRVSMRSSRSAARGVSLDPHTRRSTRTPFRQGYYSLFPTRAAGDTPHRRSIAAVVCTSDCPSSSNVQAHKATNPGRSYFGLQALPRRLPNPWRELRRRATASTHHWTTHGLSPQPKCRSNRPRACKPHRSNGSQRRSLAHSMPPSLTG